MHLDVPIAIVAPKVAGSSPVGHPRFAGKTWSPASLAEPRLLQPANQGFVSLVTIA
jgi:hypothetical protein